MLQRKFTSAILVYVFLFSTVAFAQTKIYEAPKADIDRIKLEGSQNSQVMPTLSYLTDVIGARLTGSPNMKRANEWTREQMTKWGMQNAHLEAWGPFGRGWSLKNFTAQVTSPQLIPLIAYPNAWSPSTKGAVTGDVVLFESKTEADFEKYRGKLKGKIVMVSGLRPLAGVDKPLMSRTSDEDLLKLANSPEPSGNPNQIPVEIIQNFVKNFNYQTHIMKFLMDEGASVMVYNSGGGSGGTFFVQGASLAVELSPEIRTLEDLFGAAGFNPQRKGADANMLPQLTLASEDYNRLVRMIGFGVTPKMTVNIDAQYHDDDPMSYNTVAEIPGSDPALKDEVVMLGGHLDSWHSATGATDNGAGCAVAMEAARIIMASGLKPRRTIRVALWSGEEQGLYGSTYYARQHLGEMKDGKFVKGADWDKISAYYNLDNGTGKIRGVYLQGNAAVYPIFRKWLLPFGEMGASTLTMNNTGGTDHLSFDAVGIPGFQFIQDTIEYNTRTHHSNQDNFDRIQAEDMKQASTIMAAFVYQTAMMDEKLPRKPMN